VTLLMAAATNFVGLSYALGAFVAGMLISETKYRYQVESDIAPFRDILLGLFFISVGMLLNVSVLVEHIGLIILLLILFLVFKIGLIALLTKFYGFEMGVGVRTGIILGQAGEFSFVVLALGLQTNLIDGDSLQLVLSVAVLSMLVAPFIIQKNGRIARALVKSYSRNSIKVVDTIQEHSQDLRDHVIICGYGRSGQYLGRFLREENIPYVALDMDASRVQEAASAGENVIYGDAGRRSVLEAAGLARAKAVIISYAETRGTMKVLHVIQERNPSLPVIVRTHDDSEMDALRDAGAAEVVPEILEGSLMLASHALVTLGVPLNRVVKRIRLFREERYKMFKGYFRGVSDADTATASLPQLHSVEVYKNFYAHGLRLDHIPFGDFAVEVKQLRRPNMPEPIAPRDDIMLNEGDILVLLGSNAALIAMEVYLISGRKP